MTQPSRHDPIDCLDRLASCVDCHWVGRSGELIAGDKLRCPKCRSDSVGYHIADRSETIQ